ncbi:MAG: cysteine peptidase family C39 domain-containing protein [bacterium]
MKRKVYVVKQISEKDCGPACLLSIIKYYNGFVNLEKIKIDANTDLSGTTAFELINASNKYGFDAAGFKLDKEKLLCDSRVYPFIAQVNVRMYSHFVVVYEVNNKKVTIMDPAYGIKILNIEEFLEISTENIIEFYPRSNILFLKKENAVLDLFYEVIKQEKTLLIKIIILSIFLTLISIFTSFYFKVIIECLNKDISIIKFLCFFFFILIVYKIIFTNIRILYLTHLNKNLLTRLYKEFFDHLFLLPSKTIEKKSVGEIVTRINDLGNIKNAFSEIIVSIFLDLMLTIIAVPILIYININLFIILLIILIMYIIIGLLYSRFIFKKIIKNKELESNFNTKVIEDINMFKNIKNLNITQNILKSLEDNISKLIFSNFNLEKFYNQESYLKNIINELGFYCINTIGLYYIYIGKLDIINLILFNTVTSFFFEPIKNLINNIPRYYFIKASFYKLNEFMSIDEEKLGIDIALKSFDIELDNISYSYNGYKEILSSISFSIAQGEHVFLKGKSGGGKSTLCKLLIKENVISNGIITIGGNNIDDLSLRAIRNQIIYISQKEYLFSGTIFDNITFYREVDYLKFLEICKLTLVDDVLNNKKLRYESFIELDSNNLSGGEKQRLILARACLSDFNILIIDEALSELDSKNEVKIINNLRKYFSDKTIIYISHKNLSKYFNKVVDLDEI